MQRQHVRYLLEQLGPETPITRLTPSRIAGVLEAERAGRRPGRARPLSGGTLRKRASTLSQAIELATGRAPKLPELPYTYRPRASYLRDLDAYDRLRDRMPPARRVWLSLALWTGQRRSDVERMTTEDFILAQPTVEGATSISVGGTTSPDLTDEVLLMVLKNQKAHRVPVAR